jgi:diketogulonate reductase-like aldo/keto reductase
MISLESNSTPLMIYGTAWKAEWTAELVVKALEAGFRAIDTAAQPKHYKEDLVGNAIRDCIQRGLFEREDIYIQTKFTPLSG